MTHPADPPSHHRTDAVAAEGAARTAGAPQDRKTSAPPQGSRRAETAVAQGQFWSFIL